MSAAFKASSALINDAGSGKTVPWPAGHKAGDYAILITTSEESASPPGADSLTTAAGFTLIGTAATAAGTSLSGLYNRITAWYCVATSGAMASPVVASNGHSAQSACAQILTFSGALNAAPDTFAISTGLANAASLTGLTSTAANDLIVAAISQFNGTGFSGWTNANLANFQEYADGTAATVGFGGQLGFAMATGVARSAAAIGASTVTGTAVTYQEWAGIVIALKPAATVTVTKDATAGNYFPASEAEWSTLFDGDGFPTPFAASGFQGAGTPDTDYIDGESFADSGFSYQQTVAGYTRKAIQVADGTGLYALSTNNYGGAGDSTLSLSWLSLLAAPSVLRTLHYHNAVEFDLTTAGKLRLAVSGTNTDGTSAPVGTGLFPVVVKNDFSASVIKAYTPTETIVAAGTYANGANRFYWGGASQQSTSMQLAGAAIWHGRAAEYTDTAVATVLYRVANGPRVASIAITPTTATIAPLATQALAATGTLADTSTKTLTTTATWSSSNPSVATVSSAGLVTALTAGVANITCTFTSLNAAQATSNVVVITVSGGGAISATYNNPTTTTLTVLPIPSAKPLALYSDTFSVSPLGASWTQINTVSVAGGLLTVALPAGNDGTVTNGLENGAALLVGDQDFYLQFQLTGLVITTGTFASAFGVGILNDTLTPIVEFGGAINGSPNVYFSRGRGSNDIGDKLTIAGIPTLTATVRVLRQDATVYAEYSTDGVTWNAWDGVVPARTVLRRSGVVTLGEYVMLYARSSANTSTAGISASVANVYFTSWDRYSNAPTVGNLRARSWAGGNRVDLSWTNPVAGADESRSLVIMRSPYAPAELEPVDTTDDTTALFDVDMTTPLPKFVAGDSIEWSSRYGAIALPTTLFKLAIDPSLAGLTLQKTIATGTDAAAYSLTKFSNNGWVEFVVIDTTLTRVVGLSTQASASNTGTAIQYGIRQDANGHYVVENGIVVFAASGTQVNDVLRIERTGTTVVYKRNGTTYYTSAVVSYGDLHVDLWLREVAASVADLHFYDTGIPTPVTWQKFVGMTLSNQQWQVTKPVIGAGSFSNTNSLSSVLTDAIGLNFGTMRRTFGFEFVDVGTNPQPSAKYSGTALDPSSGNSCTLWMTFRVARYPGAAATMASNVNTAGTLGWRLYLGTTGSLNLQFFGATTVTATLNANSYCDGAWHGVLVMIDWNLGTLRLWGDLDGYSAAVALPSFPGPITTSSFTLGASTIASDISAFMQVVEVATWEGASAVAVKDPQARLLFQLGLGVMPFALPTGATATYTRTGVAAGGWGYTDHLETPDEKVAKYAPSTSFASAQFFHGFHPQHEHATRMDGRFDQAQTNVLNDSEGVAPLTFTSATANATALSPMGLHNAVSLTQTALDGRVFYSVTSLITASFYYVSVYLKSEVGGHKATVWIRDSSDGTGTVSQQNDVYVPPYWKRFSFRVSTGTGTTLGVRIYGGFAGTDASKTISLFGRMIQLATGSDYQADYVPSGPGAPGTRGSSSLQIGTSGTSIASAAKGEVRVQHVRYKNTIGVTGYVFRANGVTGGHQMFVTTTDTLGVFVQDNANATVASIASGVLSPSSPIETRAAWNAASAIVGASTNHIREWNDGAVSASGGVVAYTPGPDDTTIVIGSNTSGAGFYLGGIAFVRFTAGNPSAEGSLLPQAAGLDPLGTILYSNTMIGAAGGAAAYTDTTGLAGKFYYYSLFVARGPLSVTTFQRPMTTWDRLLLAPLDTDVGPISPIQNRVGALFLFDRVSIDGKRFYQEFPEMYRRGDEEDRKAQNRATGLLDDQATFMQRALDQGHDMITGMMNSLDPEIGPLGLIGTPQNQTDIVDQFLRQLSVNPDAVGLLGTARRRLWAGVTSILKRKGTAQALLDYVTLITGWKLATITQPAIDFASRFLRTWDGETSRFTVAQASTGITSVAGSVTIPGANFSVNRFVGGMWLDWFGNVKKIASNTATTIVFSDATFIAPFEVTFTSATVTTSAAIVPFVVNDSQYSFGRIHQTGLTEAIQISNTVGSSSQVQVALAYPLTPSALTQAMGGYGVFQGGYLLDDASGNLVPAFGPTTLTTHGTPTYGNAGPLGGGDLAIGFPNATSYFDGGNAFPAGANDLVIVWVGKISALPLLSDVVQRATGFGHGGYGLRIAADGTYRLDVSDISAGKFAQTSTAVTIGTWHVGVAVVDRTSNTMRIATQGLDGSNPVISAATLISGLGSTDDSTGGLFTLGATSASGYSNGSPTTLQLAYMAIGTGVGAAVNMSSNLATAVDTLRGQLAALTAGSNQAMAVSSNYTGTFAARVPWLTAWVFNGDHSHTYHPGSLLSLRGSAADPFFTLWPGLSPTGSGSGFPVTEDDVVVWAPIGAARCANRPVLWVSPDGAAMVIAGNTTGSVTDVRPGDYVNPNRNQPTWFRIKSTYALGQAVYMQVAFDSPVTLRDVAALGDLATIAARQTVELDRAVRALTPAMLPLGGRIFVYFSE